MDKNSKRTLSSIFFFLTSFIYFFLAYIGFKKQNIDLKNYSKTESVIIDKGVDYRIGSKGRKSKCFYILLKDHDKKLGVYRMNKNYSDLLAKFNIIGRIIIEGRILILTLCRLIDLDKSCWTKKNMNEKKVR